MRFLSTLKRQGVRYALAAFGGLLCAAEVQAAPWDATSIQITPPTTRTDGSALSGSAIKAYRLYFGCPSAPVQQGADFIGAPPFQRDALAPADGTYDVCVTVVDTGDRESALSNAIRYTLASVAGPNPPTLEGVQFACPSGGTPRITQITPAQFEIECDAP